MASEFIDCQVALPPNVQAGAKLMIQIDNSGRKFQIVVPPGGRGGQTIRVRVPRAPPPTPIAQGRFVTPQQQQSYRPQQPQQQQPSGVLWHGWFYKQQPHFPHGWQKRYGSVCPRSGTSSNGAYELIYYSNDTDMRSGNRRGSLPLSWGEIPSAFKGKLCLDGPPTKDGKQQFILQTANRDYNISFGSPITSASAFYLCYRVCVCGDDLQMAKAAIYGNGSSETDENMATYRFQNLHTEQTRIEALGLDRFETAAMLVRTAGDGEVALPQLLAEDYKRRGVPFSPPNTSLAAASEAAGPDAEAKARARRDLVSMGFSNLDAMTAVEKHGTDVDTAMLWLLQEHETPKLKGERYELNFDTGPLGVKVTTGNEYTCDFPIVKPSEGTGSRHISTWENAHLPNPGHVCEAYSVQGGQWVILSGTADEKYDECINAATGPRPVSFRIVAVDGVGPLKEKPPSQASPPSYSAVSKVHKWEYQKGNQWYTFPDDAQYRLSTAASSGVSCVEGISVDGVRFNVFLDTMTQFNTSTNEQNTIRHPSHHSPPPPVVPSLDEMALQQNWENQQNEQAHAPLLDFLDAPDAPVLMAQSSDDSDGGLALFATLLTNDEAAHVASAQRAECSVCFEDLCAEPVGLFFDNSGGRVCQHFFHYQCACELPAKCCPLCNREFSKPQQLPDPLESPKQWFAMVDATGSGTLDKRDVVEALKAQLPVNADKLEAHFDDLWKRWDADGSGDLSLDELFKEKNGLLEYLKHLKGRSSEAIVNKPGVASEAELVNLLTSASINDVTAKEGAPRLDMASRQEWFQYFDVSSTGRLNKSELTTAINSSGGQVDGDMVAMLMMTCDLRSEGEVFEDEFMKQGGLAEVLIASLGL